MNAAPKTLRQLSDLDAAGLTAVKQRAALEKVAAQYAIAITPAMAELVDRADPNDPIARQFVPDAAELAATPEERADPIGDGAHSPVTGIVHRYPDRALLKLTHTCAVYCRFCFRREMVGPGAEPLTAQQLDAALDYVAAHPEIWEVILTGGDPLVLSPRRIKAVMSRLAANEHVKIVRVHSRVPVAEPSRITPALVRALKIKGKATYVVLHANHARELTDAAREACNRFIDAGIPMLSQSVLLAGVNDDPRTLGALMRTLVECRIKPYYLHHGDLAPGTSHLRTSIAHGQELMRALRGRFSGLCQPEYVLDIPGGHGKSPIGPSYLSPDGAGGWRVQDFNGETHCYPPKT
jgi:lysine 2,3-aminomutase